MKLKEIMTQKIISCDIKDNISKISNTMKKNDIGFIPIMNKNKLYGIVTDRDIACNIDKPLKSFITTKIINIEENKTPEEALELMKKHKIKRLIITNQNKITGIISLSDLYNTNIESQTILETLKEIYAINRNNGYYNTNIDDFRL